LLAGLLREDGKFFDTTSSTAASSLAESNQLPPNANGGVGGSSSVSSEVMKAIISEALQRRDTKTIHMVLAEAARVGTLTAGALEGALEQCLSARDLRNACFVLEKYIVPRGVQVVKMHLVQTLVRELVLHCNWQDASVAAAYLIANDAQFAAPGERDIFLIIGGLMMNTRGVVRALELLLLITEKRRIDLCKLFSYTKVNRFSLSMGGSHSYRVALPKQPLENLMISSLCALRGGGSSINNTATTNNNNNNNNIAISPFAVSAVVAAGGRGDVQPKQGSWFSFSISKMLVALACGSGNHDLAEQYVRESMKIATEQLTAENRRLAKQAKLVKEKPIFENKFVPTPNALGDQVDLLDMLKVCVYVCVCTPSSPFRPTHTLTHSYTTRTHKQTHTLTYTYIVLLTRCRRSKQRRQKLRRPRGRLSPHACAA